jgi:hypothetical protein
MRFFNRTENPNTLVGIFLLVLLAVFIGPNMLPRIVSSVAPNIDEAVPCAWLQNGFNRANHQSLIGRAAVNPIRLAVRTSSVPNSADTRFSITITVINESLGTVPIVYHEQQVIMDDNGTSGLGIIFDAAVNLPMNNARQDASSFPESNIRLLGPRMRCVHRMDFPANQVSITPGTSIRAFYRITSAGQITQLLDPSATPIYPDQGLAVIRNGYVESQPFTIPITLTAQ